MPCSFMIYAVVIITGSIELGLVSTMKFRTREFHKVFAATAKANLKRGSP